MNKLDLIQKLIRSHDITKSQAAKVVEHFFDQMATALANSDRIEIRGLCSFKVKSYKPYTGRNPETGKQVPVAPKKLPVFKCGTELKERVNGAGSNGR